MLQWKRANDCTTRTSATTRGVLADQLSCQLQTELLDGIEGRRRAEILVQDESKK